ncbi:hypothetical protein C882_1083 [Caenispirillum salinarum AK4]|uniref:Glycine zipper domain-containing protein n=1 Tax=Caenispirillum salinarum AK4 TaxID=1238182 RepID=K9GSE0_9PROT|nr:hypothetical protein [Caenispirillum salinarum]EKV28082.1 hypothetical protein C882_1083 [Caenispirillum salinarum AK4]
MTTTRKSLTLTAVAALVLATAGCSNLSRDEQRALTGGALGAAGGAAAGALIGGSVVGGALLGGAGGALIGGLTDIEIDR